MSATDVSRLTVGENVSRLVPYRPGKPIDEVKRELGLTEVVKLASNENALGPSPRAIEAIHVAAARVHLYPDGSCHDLRLALADHLGVPGNHLVFGNGSDEIIHLLGLTFLQPGDEVIVAHPSFVRYESAAILNQAPCHNVPLRDWTHDLDAMADRFNGNTRLVFVANPNNPTGTIVTRPQVDLFLRRVPERSIVVFDEAYYEYVESPDYPDTIRYALEGRNVITLRTVSKAYGLAGLRVGYGIARPDIVGYLDQVREPFNVSSIAQAAGVAALTDCEHVRRSKEMNRAGKQRFYEAFRRMDLDFTPTEANFVWFDAGRDCTAVFQALLARGVIVRTGDIFGADTHLRVTIGTEPENEKFLAALKEALSQ